MQYIFLVINLFNFPYLLKLKMCDFSLSVNSTPFRRMEYCITQYSIRPLLIVILTSLKSNLLNFDQYIYFKNINLWYVISIIE
jgi:hypothetical protein